MDGRPLSRACVAPSHAFRTRLIQAVNRQQSEGNTKANTAKLSRGTSSLQAFALSVSALGSPSDPSYEHFVNQETHPPTA